MLRRHDDSVWSVAQDLEFRGKDDQRIHERSKRRRKDKINLKAEDALNKAIRRDGLRTLAEGVR